MTSSLILCFLPLHIHISTFGMTHPISIFFCLLGLFFLFLYGDRYKLDKLILSGIFLGFGTAARLSDGLIIIAAIFLYLTLSFRDSNISKKAIINRLLFFLISFSVVILLLYLPMLLKNGLSQFREVFSAYYLSHSLKYLYFSWKWLIDVLSVNGIVILIAGLYYFILEKEKTLLCFLLIWFFSIFVYLGRFIGFQHRSLILVIFPLLIVQGYFVSKAFYRFKFLIPLLVFTFIAKNFIAFYPIAQFSHRYNLQKDFAEFVKNNTEPTSYIIAMDEGFFIEYYANRRILYKAIGCNKKDFDDFFNEVDRLLNNGNKIYIISTGIYGYDPNKYFINTLLNNYNLKYIGQRPNQDWHSDSIYTLGLFIEKLYKIEKKT
jgi:hypothetical protein